MRHAAATPRDGLSDCCGCDASRAPIGTLWESSRILPEACRNHVGIVLESCGGTTIFNLVSIIFNLGTIIFKLGTIIFNLRTIICSLGIVARVQGGCGV
jgi:hypothetical protein